MPDSVSERRLVENEVMSRKPNLKVSRDFDNLKRIAEEDSQAHLLPDDDPNILFLCECSDEKCKTRIKLKKSTYDELHKNSKRFLLVPGHNIPSIERIVKSEKNYMVVEKFITPPKDATKFNPTDLDNSKGES
jgi:hypothetical protein